MPTGAYSAANWSTATIVKYTYAGGTGVHDPGTGHEQWVFTMDGTYVEMFELADRCVSLPGIASSLEREQA